MTNFDHMFSSKEKDPFWERVFDKNTVHGRCLTIVLPLLYAAFVIVGTALLDVHGKHGSDASFLFFMLTTFGVFFGSILGCLAIQGAWWIFTGKPKWQW